MSEPTAKPVTLRTLSAMKARGEKIVALTAYDALFAGVLESAGVELLLVGDSLGMVVQGHDSTLPVRMEDMVYHAAAVGRGSHRALRIADMPFMSYATLEQALSNAARLMQEGGAHMVKLEGGGSRLPIVRHLVEQGIPVCGHVGLLPQSVHKLGGFRVQGREPESARRIKEDALALQEAGAELLVLECIPSTLAADITSVLRIPTIGIGAGAACDGQVLVLQDLLGVTSGNRPRFVKDFLAGASGVAGAVAAYVRAVKDGVFPAPEHGYD